MDVESSSMGSDNRTSPAFRSPMLQGARPIPHPASIARAIPLNVSNVIMTDEDAILRSIQPPTGEPPNAFPVPTHGYAFKAGSKEHSL